MGIPPVNKPPIQETEATTNLEESQAPTVNKQQTSTQESTNVNNAPKNYTGGPAKTSGNAPLLEPPQASTVDHRQLMIALASISDNINKLALQGDYTSIEGVEGLMNLQYKDQLQQLQKSQEQQAKQHSESKAGGIFGWIASAFMIVAGAVLDATGVGAALGTALIVGGVIGLAMQTLQATGAMAAITGGLSDLLQDMGVPKEAADIVANAFVAVAVIAATIAVTVATAGAGAGEAVDAISEVADSAENIADDASSVAEDASNVSKEGDSVSGETKAGEDETAPKTQKDSEIEMTNLSDNQEEMVEEEQSPANKAVENLEKRMLKDAEKVLQEVEASEGSGGATGAKGLSPAGMKFAAKLTNALVQMVPQLVQSGLQVAEGVSAKDQAAFEAMAQLDTGQIQACQNLLNQNLQNITDTMQAHNQALKTIQNMIQAQNSAQSAAANSI